MVRSPCSEPRGGRYLLAHRSSKGERSRSEACKGAWRGDRGLAADTACLRRLGTAPSHSKSLSDTSPSGHPAHHLANGEQAKNKVRPGDCLWDSEAWEGSSAGQREQQANLGADSQLHTME